MKKKSLISMLATLSLVGVIMVGATLAYLTDKTDDVVNTFTIGKVDINLTEPNWKPEEGLDLEPGAEIAKDPTVTNTGKNDAFVAVKVTGMDAMAAVGFEADVNDETGAVVEGWDGSLVDGIYAYAKSALAKGDASVPVFSEVRFMDNGVYNQSFTINEVPVDETDETAGTYFVIEGVDKTFETEAAAREYIASLEALQDTTSFDLVIKAFAIQTTGFEMVTDNVYTWVAEFDFAE